MGYPGPTFRPQLWPDRSGIPRKRWARGKLGPPPAPPLPLPAPPTSSALALLGLPGTPRCQDGCPPGVAGPGYCQECGSGSGHPGTAAWWGTGGQRQVGSARIPEPGRLRLPWTPAREDLFFITTTNYPEEEKNPTTKTTIELFFVWNLLLMAHWLYIIKQAAGDLPG